MADAVVIGAGFGGLALAIRGREVGDLYCHLFVETPVKLTSKQEELLREFESISRGLSYSQSPKQSTFFDKIKRFFN